MTSGPELTREENARLMAAIDLIHRTGAVSYEVGYDIDDESIWQAQAFFRGARVWGNHRPDPVTATESLLEEVVDDGMCTHCRRRCGVLLPTDGPEVRARARLSNVCWYDRMGNTYLRGCS